MIVEHATTALLARLLREVSCEVCGVLMRARDGQNWVSLPTAGTGEHRFAITREAWRRVVDFATARGATIEAFVHSHIHSLALSDHDRVTLDSGDLRWVVVRLVSAGLESAIYEPRPTPNRATS